MVNCFLVHFLPVIGCIGGGGPDGGVVLGVMVVARIVVKVVAVNKNIKKNASPFDKLKET